MPLEQPGRDGDAVDPASLARIAVEGLRASLVRAPAPDVEERTALGQPEAAGDSEALQQATATLRALCTDLPLSTHGRSSSELRDVTLHVEEACRLLHDAARRAAQLAAAAGSSDAMDASGGGGVPGTSGSSRPPATTRSSALADAVLAVAGCVLSAPGASFCSLVSQQPECMAAWLRSLSHVAAAWRLLYTPQHKPVQLLPLWTCLKGVAGLRSPAVEARLAAVAFLHALLVADASAPELADPATVAAGVSRAAICIELACHVAPHDAHPAVSAAALRVAAALFALCRDACSGRQWRMLVAGVAQVAAASSRGGEAWEAALEFARTHGEHPGWRTAVSELREQLQQAAEEEGGPLGAYGIEAICRSVAGATALDAAVRRGGDAANPSGAGAGAAAAAPLLLSAAVCLSDAMRRGVFPHGESSSSGACGQQIAADPSTGSPDPAAGAQGQAAAGDDRESADALKAAPAVAVAALATCGSAASMLSPPEVLEVLEALVERAGSAPLVFVPASGASASGPAPPSACKAALLAAVGAAAGGAAAALRAATGGADAPARHSPRPAHAADAGKAATHLAAALRVAKAMQRIAALLQEPDRLLFGEVGSSPSLPADSNAEVARQHYWAVAAGAHALQALLGVLPTPLVVTPRRQEPIDEGGSPHERDGSSRAASASPQPQPTADAWPRRKPKVVIEELPSDSFRPPGPEHSPAQQAASEWRRNTHQLACDLLYLCAAYAPPTGGAAAAAAAAAATAAPAGVRPGPHAGVRGSAAAAAAADVGLPPPPSDVFTPWADPAAAAACARLLDALRARTAAVPAPSRSLSSPTSAGAGSLALLSAEQLAEQELLAACLQDLLYDRLRLVVVQRHVQSLEEGPIRPYDGPDPFARALAARRLSWLLMRSRHPFAGEALRVCLPALLACCDDPSPGVGQYGAAALHSAAVECMAADLQWQRELLLEQARRMMVGCPEQLWHLALPAALALVRRIEGKDPRAAAYHRLTSELWPELERQAHVPARRLPFLAVAPHLAACLGLTLVRHFSRLMPLLLEWLHAYDGATRVAALRALAAVVRAAWPRVSAHAAVLWRHMLLVLLRVGRAGGRGAGSGGGADDGGEEEERGAREVCALLLVCAREQVVAFDPDAAGLAGAAKGVHSRLLQGAGPGEAAPSS